MLIDLDLCPVPIREQESIMGWAYCNWVMYLGSTLDESKLLSLHFCDRRQRG